MEEKRLWILRKADYVDNTPIAAYDDEELAEAAYKRYDEGWGNYDLDEVPLNPVTPGPGNIYTIRLDPDGKLRSHPSAHPYTPDFRPWSEGQRRTQTNLTSRTAVFDRYLYVWGEDQENALAKAQTERVRLQAAGLWDVDGRIMFGEDGPE